MNIMFVLPKPKFERDAPPLMCALELCSGYCPVQCFVMPCPTFNDFKALHSGFSSQMSACKAHIRSALQSFSSIQ